MARHPLLLPMAAMLDERRIQDYRVMMDDRIRMETYMRAIRRHCPNRVVLDLGAGLGPLSLLALHAGARRVYAIEADGETLDLATRVALHNGFGADRFVPVCATSLEADLPERAEVLVSETLDGIGIGENTHRFVADARRRLLTADARLIPERLELFVAPAEAKGEIEERRFWQKDLSRFYGLDYSSAVEDFARLRQSLSLSDPELMSPWHRWTELDFRRHEGHLPPSITVETRARRPGTVRGVAFAFVAHLDESLTIDTRTDQRETHWQQGWISCVDPRTVREGDPILIRIYLGASDAAWIPVAAAVDTSAVPAGLGF